MKTLSIPCIALCVGLSTTAAFARGGMGGAHGMGSSHMSMMGGAFGTTAAPAPTRRAQHFPQMAWAAPCRTPSPLSTLKTRRSTG
jgi:hypothetical protein